MICPADNVTDFLRARNSMQSNSIHAQLKIEMYDAFISFNLKSAMTLRPLVFYLNNLHPV